MGRGIKEFIRLLGDPRQVAATLVHLETIPPTTPSWDEPNPPLPASLAAALEARGVTRLYTHQVRAITLLRQGKDVVLATPTASGKTLAYTLPIMELLLTDPSARAIMVYPLKALEQDQLGAINSLAMAAGMGPVAEIYDGDTPEGLRRKIREHPPAVLITNPDMLHASVCAYPDSWEELLGNLKILVLDELHTYRGVFGAHVANVIRRLLRLAARAGANPRIVMSSATTANPAAHASALIGREINQQQVVSQSGAPMAERHVALVEPVGAAATTAAAIVAAAVRAGLKVICFTRSRIYTELIYTWIVGRYRWLKNKVAGYRAGLLPSERRNVERAMASGRLQAVVSTSALELGIDIGGLDVCVLVGYPGSQVGLWQRAGRVGRARRASAVVMIAQPDALDQYFMAHPQQLVRRQVEAAVVDPSNPCILSQHLLCAAAEAPFEPEVDRQFFDMASAGRCLQELTERGEIFESADGRAYHAARLRPQLDVDLRGAGEGYCVVEHSGRVVGSLDGVRAFREGHPGAIYLHQGRTYLVRELDIAGRRVVVSPVSARYYTRVRTTKTTTILEEYMARAAKGVIVRFGRLRVSERIIGYERRRINGGELMGVHELQLPPLVFTTQGMWLEIPEPVIRELKSQGAHIMGSLHALEHAAIGIFPLLVLCERTDLGGISTTFHPQVEGAAVFIYDGVEGGVGLARKGYDVVEELLKHVHELLSTCPCEAGCPGCIHSPRCGSGNKPLDKAGSLMLVRSLLETTLPAPSPRPKPQPPAEPAPSTQPLRYGVVDLETQMLAQEVGGWANAHRMRVSVAVVYDSATDSYHTYWEDEIPELLEHLSELELVVGFNLVRFDYRVLGAYAPGQRLRLPTLDILAEIHQRLGRRASLEAVATATLGEAKTGHGLLAVRWWREGEHEKLVEYCRKDVELTKRLFLFGQQHGYLLVERRGGLIKIPVHWDWASLRARLD